MESVKLMVKTGRFFANCDGNYDENERRLLDGFASSIEILADISDEQKNEVLATLGENPTLDQLIEETKNLMERSNPRERKRMLDVFDQFIRMTIASDHRIERVELSCYMEWRRRLGLTE